MYQVGSTSNAVFGAKIIWNYVEWAMENIRELPRFSQITTEQIVKAMFPD